MSTPALPVVLDPVAAYHGDTVTILATVSASWGTGVGDLSGATARLQLRDKSELLVLDLEPVVASAELGRIEVAPVTLTPEQWASVKRSNVALDYDLEVRHPSVGTVTLVRGHLLITRDVTR